MFCADMMLIDVFAVVRPFRDQHGTLLYTYGYSRIQFLCLLEVVSILRARTKSPSLARCFVTLPSFGRTSCVTFCSPSVRLLSIIYNIAHPIRTVINGETATYAAPSFKDKLMRTFKGQLQQLCSKTDTQKSARKQDPLYALVDQRSQRPPLQVLTHQSARTNKVRCFN